MKISYYIVFLFGWLLALAGCKQKAADEALQPEESKAAKQLLQGVWIDEESETVAFKVKGDSVYYPDSTSLPVYFRVIEDTLVMGDGEAKYPIVKQAPHVFWFMNPNNDLVKVVKSNDPLYNAAFERRPQSKPLIITEVLKRDTVVTLDGERYHCYTTVNPTKYKVVRSQYNEDGLQVNSVYYDNIIHVSIFKGTTRVFSSNFRKQMFAQKVPAAFLSQSVLSNMEFDKADDKGFHFNATLCIPDEASCYMVATVISKQGKTSMELLEY